MLDHVPTVFVSYSWSNDIHKKNVKSLADRLIHDGINVIIDIYDLKDGQDKYLFMEKSVKDPSIDKVLILCDKVYAEKADNRNGGVGNETTIISSKVYKDAMGKEEKFIPVIMQYDEQGMPPIPAYLSSRIYIDLTDDKYEDGYKHLVRTIYNEPENPKPPLGKTPTWLSSDEPDYESGVDINRLSSYSKTNLQSFLDIYVEITKSLWRSDYRTDEQYIHDFKSIKYCRNVFLDYIKDNSDNIGAIGEKLAYGLEYLYNNLCSLTSAPSSTTGYNRESFDLFKTHMWELFICVNTFLLHYKKYHDINALLTHTYFLAYNPLSTEEQPCCYDKFRFYSNFIEGRIKPSSEYKHHYTLMGHMLCNEREYGLIYRKEQLANADLFLYQIHKAFNYEGLKTNGSWFPTCYVYVAENQSDWNRLISKEYCKTLFPLFDVNNMKDFKDKISKCIHDSSVRHQGAFDSPPSILDYISLEKIASIP